MKRFIKRFMSISFCSFFAANAIAETSLRNTDNEFFVVLKSAPAFPGSADYSRNKMRAETVRSLIEREGGRVMDTYLYAFVGHLIYVNDSEALEKIRRDDRVALIEANGPAQLLEPIVDSDMLVKSWGLDRIDQRSLPLDSTFDINYTGASAHSYVIDTGLRATHKEFQGRVGAGYSALPDDKSTNDCNGHGTHVAGTVMGASVGVAVKTLIHPVRVFGCNGGTTWDIVVKALDWVAKNHKKPANANLSLGGAANQAVDLAVTNTIKAGVTVIVAAGNANRDACTTSPARVPAAITVAASSRNDSRAGFSNWGKCVDIFAPGSGILSASHTGDNAYRSLSGTSMAAPHLAGAASLVGSLHPRWNPLQVTAAIMEVATQGKVTDPKSVNRLLYVKSFGRAPIADAGKDVIKRFPNSDVTLLGIAKDMDGQIMSSRWDQIGGKTIHFENSSFGWQHKLVLKKLTVGKYRFRFTVMDNDGMTAADEVSVWITSKNLVPIADAGSNMRVNLGAKVMLTGDKSFDLDGAIASYSWEKISGPSAGRIVDPDAARTPVVELAGGSYVFELTVVDNEGSQAKDRVTIRVNLPPIADAGADQRITYPQRAVKLLGSGKDPEGGALRYRWRKVRGPAGDKIHAPGSAHTVVSGLKEGIYIYELHVTDDNNASHTDQMQVTVIDPNRAPILDAGEDIVITLPENSATLHGSCSDSDGHCVRVGWQFLRKFESLNRDELDFEASEFDTELHLTDLTPGVYEFLLFGFDDKGKRGQDHVRVTVMKAEEKDAT